MTAQREISETGGGSINYFLLCHLDYWRKASRHKSVGV